MADRDAAGVLVDLRVSVVMYAASHAQADTNAGGKAGVVIVIVDPAGHAESCLQRAWAASQICFLTRLPSLTIAC
jgi:hypothetical protein